MADFKFIAYEVQGDVRRGGKGREVQAALTQPRPERSGVPG